MWLSINVVDRHVLYIIYTYIPNLLSLSCSVVQAMFKDVLTSSVAAVTPSAILTPSIIID